MDVLTIHSKILELVNTKYSQIIDFEFVTREKKMIFVPSVPNDWEWGFDNVKELFGQGKLYFRLKGVTINGSKQRNRLIDEYLENEPPLSPPSPAPLSPLQTVIPFSIPTTPVESNGH